EIAPRYDLLNHLLSASVDRRWRKIAVAKVAELLGSRTMSQCLDLCSGTGDLALALHRQLQVNVVASDFCHPMLVRGLEKVRSSGFDRMIRTVEADSMSLPFAGKSFDAVTIGFGLRNLEDCRRGLIEMNRVLKTGGAIVVLEFSRPVIPVFR